MRRNLLWLLTFHIDPILTAVHCIGMLPHRRCLRAEGAVLGEDVLSLAGLSASPWQNFNVSQRRTWA